MSQQKPVIGITIGDLNGIGPEVVIKAFSDARMLQFCTPVIYASTTTINYHRKVIDAKTFNFQVVNSINHLQVGKVNLINLWDESLRFNLGTPDAENGKYSFMSIRKAAEDAHAGKLDGIVTAPIDKFSIQSEEFQFPGHTEYFADVFGSKTLMLMLGEELKIGVVTGHVPLSEVSTKLTKEIIREKLVVLGKSLISDFGIPMPKIAVLGLNPHAGDNGLIGKEEIEVIRPVIADLKAKGMLAFGPYPTDGFFGTRQYRNFDGVLAMYHDQGLTPFKLLDFETGVNYTAGLPIVRTSPDHGTAYDIAGKNIADESSFRNAVYKACEIIRNRQNHTEMNENPLKTRMVKEKDGGA
jgi:4-hydroxythreonine-4-phosphate dehydrogenase